MASQVRDFMGAKLALFLGPRLLVLQRDDRPDLLWPGFWDLPGGGREEGEGPLECALRETWEEFGLRVPAAQIRWARAHTNSIGRTVWFFVGQISARAEEDVRFGQEGQSWDLLDLEAFLDHDKVVPQFKTRILAYREGAAPDPMFASWLAAGGVEAEVL